MEFLVSRTSITMVGKPIEWPGIYETPRGWCLKVETVDELVEIVKQCGKIVLDESWDGLKGMTIEVYDDWRE